MTIGNKIRFIRKSLNLSQEEFAKEINKNQKAISAIELGNRRATYQFLQSLVEKFSVNPMWLFDLSEEPFLKKE